MCYFCAVDLEVCVWMWEVCFDDLLDCQGAEGVFAVALTVVSRETLLLDLEHVTLLPAVSC